MFFVSNTFPSNVSSIFHPASLRSSSISLLCYPSCPWSHVSQIPHFPRVYPSCPWSYISIKSSTSSVFIPHVRILYFYQIPHFLCVYPSCPSSYVSQIPHVLRVYPSSH
uniref:Uncharacterized protein n=1 Tax=Cacopsylla melanoneura TaxID=428564 RepID=A0A8D8Z7U2_9HEMI